MCAQPITVYIPEAVVSAKSTSRVAWIVLIFVVLSVHFPSSSVLCCAVPWRYAHHVSLHSYVVIASCKVCRHLITTSSPNDICTLSSHPLQLLTERVPEDAPQPLQ